MTATDWEAIAYTVAACALIAWTDPAGPARRKAARRALARAVLALSIALSAAASRLIGVADRLMPSPPPAPVPPATEPLFFEASFPKHVVTRMNVQLAWQHAQKRTRSEA